MARPRSPGDLTIRPPHTKRERPWSKGARKQGIPRRPGRRLGSPGAAGRAGPSAPRTASGLQGRVGLAPPGRAPGPSRCPGPPDPTRPRLLPAPPARRTDQALRLPPRRAQRERDSGRGLPPTPPAPPAPSPPPASPAGASHLPRAPRSHRPPAAPPPPPPAPGPSPPLRLPPQPAPPAPGSASRPRPLGAGASGQARTRVRGTLAGPLSGTPDPGSRFPSRPRPGASLRTNGLAATLVSTGGGAAAALRPVASPPAFSWAPPAGGRRAARRGAPGRSGSGVGERPAQSTRHHPGACACPPLGPSLPQPFRCLLLTLPCSGYSWGGYYLPDPVLTEDLGQISSSRKTDVKSPNLGILLPKRPVLVEEEKKK